MKRNQITNLLLLACTAFLLSSCWDPKSQQSTTKGTAKIGVDETFRLLMDTEVFTFKSHYPEALIEPVYAPEGELIDLLKSDSLRLLIIGRSLSKEELEFFASKKSHPKITKIAYDGVALIVHPENPDSNLSYEVLQSLFKGETKTWNQINQKQKNDSVRIVFDHPRSGTAHYIMDAFGIKQFPKGCFALKSNQDVVNYVAENPNAIGVIGSNWISDPEDTVSHAFLKKIHVVGLSSKNDPTAALGFFRPYQGYIATGEYPFKREINFISRELGVRVGTGFAAFVAGDIGQRIVLKAGLVPATAPIRLINVNNE